MKAFPPKQKADQAPRSTRFFIKGHISSRSASCWVPWSDHAIVLTLQMSKAAGWNYSLGGSRRNFIFKDPSANDCKTLPTSLSQSNSQWSSPADCPEIFMMWDWNGGSQEVTHMLGELDLHLVLFSHWRTHHLRGGLSLGWYCTILGKEQCSQWVAAPFTLLTQSVLGSVVKGGMLQPRSVF